MSYQNIPHELRVLVQWCVWRYEKTDSGKLTKVPYNPVTGRHTSVTDPQSWCSFEQAEQAASHNWAWSGIGFIFTNRDPYCGVDLDAPKDDEPLNPDIAARQQKIFEALDSYAERSPSGKGLHIIVKASVPHGRKRDAVEVYSDARFFTMTGNVFNAKPIADRQEIVAQLWAEMAPPSGTHNGFYGEISQNQEDDEIYRLAASAANGDKFVDLWNGNWQSYYSSQSEADFALIDIIAYYTQFVPQITRMFRNSALGARDKAKREDYVSRMIQRSFDNQLPPVDFSAIIDRMNSAQADGRANLRRTSLSAAAAPMTRDMGALGAGDIPQPGYGQAFGGVDRPSPPAPFSPDLTYHQHHAPPGLLKAVSDYVYMTSPRPVQEIALVAGLGLLAGIVGRQYNVSGTGLNQYILCVADTGKGKEAIASGISRIISQLTPKLPIAKDIRGPEGMASGQALIKHLGQRAVPCMVALTGEFGLKLQQLTSATASAADIMLKKVLLDLYAKSGAGQTIEPYIYSDKQNNTDTINSPALTLIGEGTGETVYAALDEDTVAQGLLPRFITIEYSGPRVPLNKTHAGQQMPAQLHHALEELIIHVHQLANNRTVINIPATAEADALLEQIDRHADGEINSARSDATRQLWNRVQLKVWKLAGLLAVSHNFQSPEINGDMVRWSMSLVMSDAYKLLHKFDRGEMGSQINADHVKIEKIRKALKKYIETPFQQQQTYGSTFDMHSKGVFCHQHIARRFAADTAFRKDKVGASIALQRALKEMCNMGVLNEIPQNQMQREFNHGGKGYAIIDPKWVLEG